jgi:hypothetical protein
MKINSELGYKPVPFSELTDPSFERMSNLYQYEILKKREQNVC